MAGNSSVGKPVVCHLLHSLCVGGAENLAKQFAERSREVVHTVFACLDDLGELGHGLREQGFHVEVLHRQPGIDLSLRVKLRAFWEAQGVSVVHAHQYAPFFYAALARLPGKSPPIIFTEHGRHHPDLRSLKHVWANKLLLRRSDRVVAVGEQVKAALIANEGFAARRIDVVRNGVHVEAFARQPQACSQAREKLGIPSDKFVVVQVARLNPLKDHLTAVAAMEQLVNTHPKSHLVMVGEGEERGRIEAAIKQAKLEGHVTLMGTQHDVKSFLHASDAFLLTSVSEGIPLTLIEAMSAGLPCVCTSVGGIPEVIQHGKTGLLAQAKDAQQLAKHLRTLIDSCEFRDELANNGRQHAYQHFSDNQMHRQYQAWYRELHVGQSLRG